MYTSGSKAVSQKVPADMKKTGTIAQRKDFSGTSDTVRYFKTIRIIFSKIPISLLIPC